MKLYLWPHFVPSNLGHSPTVIHDGQFSPLYATVKELIQMSPVGELTITLTEKPPRDPVLAPEPAPSPEARKFLDAMNPSRPEEELFAAFREYLKSMQENR